MNKASKLLIAGAGAAMASAAAVGAAAYASTKYLVRVALDREQPKLGNMEKAREQLRGYGNCAAFMDEMMAGAEKLETSPHDTVQIVSYDGQTLVGHWFACEEPKRILIAMHGWRSCWSSDFGTVAEFWRKNGCSVLYAEQRGQGSSGGAYMGFGMMERYDCLEWIKWVNTHWGKELPVYLAGVSMGATCFSEDGPCRSCGCPQNRGSFPVAPAARSYTSGSGTDWLRENPPQRRSGSSFP